ncbi:hypothetical protein HYH03_006082 [Edaphochlamys debaryana]|uniref:DUF1764-domain-containing protein n=1 Tax=Edaphochlamys debaryana TaxID=47281 RepID=A0A835Y4K2_9CHLO|nr:hypothetical protein HYH03_006082 [Edaphochlamys debaryana]|eukprot:KAG2495843.1 hypothetical protein HYH03_006082 [Edaphochlamys debaryana]
MGKKETEKAAKQGDGKAAPKADKPAKAEGKAAQAVTAEKAKGKGKEPEKGAKPAGGKKSEIDDIFSAGKKAAEKKSAEKRAAEEAAEKADAAAEAPAAKRSKVEGSKDDIFGEAVAKGRKRTEEGFAIYTEDELGLGSSKGGDTDLCPFDCECCF